MRILSFGHQKRVGKDTAAKMAMRHLRLSGDYECVQKRGFADKVKSQCYELYKWGGLQPGHFYDEPENEHLKEVVLPKLMQTPRQLWIGHGMACRSYYDSVWVDYLLQEVSCDFLIVSDMRFPNEAEAIKARGGRVIKITRPSVFHTSDAADDPLLQYTGWDAEIINDSDLRTFNQKVVDIVNKYYART